MRRQLRVVPLSLLFALVIATLAGCGDDTGTVVIDMEPDGMETVWVVAGPDGDAVRGSTDSTLTDRTPGDYTVTWGYTTGWIVPSRATATLDQGETVTFLGNYVRFGTIAVDVEPNDLPAPWTLTGPAGFSVSGVGDGARSGLYEGSYTITWGTVPPWRAPAGETQPLAAGSTATFDAVYTLAAAESRDWLIDNFVAAYEARDLATYTDEILHPNFKFILQDEAVEDFGLPDEIIEYEDELQIATKLFREEPGSDGHAISQIRTETMQAQGSWLRVEDDDPYFSEFDHARKRTYDVRLVFFVLGEDLQLVIDGEVDFYVLATTVEIQGQDVDVHRLLGTRDFTESGGSVMNTWSHVEANYR